MSSCLMRLSRSYSVSTPPPLHTAVRLLIQDTASLRLNGVDTKNHAIVKELTRIKQYFEKIQKIETPPSKPENTLNTEAAIRFLRTNLVGPNRFLMCVQGADCLQSDDKEVTVKLTEQIAKERAKAAIKAANERKRAAEAAATAEGQAEKQEETVSKKPKRSGSKKKK